MHRASNFSNIGKGTITIIVTIRRGHSNRKKGHSQLFNSIRISLEATIKKKKKIVNTLIQVHLHFLHYSAIKGDWLNYTVKLTVNNNFSSFLDSLSPIQLQSFPIRQN